MNDVGFSSVNVLRAHKRKHHAPNIRVDVPATFRQQMMSQAVSEDFNTTIKRLADAAAQPIDPERSHGLWVPNAYDPEGSNYLLKDFDFDAFLHGDADGQNFGFDSAALELDRAEETGA